MKLRQSENRQNGQHRFQRFLGCFDNSLRQTVFRQKKSRFAQVGRNPVGDFAQRPATEQCDDCPRSRVFFEQSPKRRRQVQKHRIDERDADGGQAQRGGDLFKKRIVRIREKFDFERRRVRRRQPMLDSGFAQKRGQGEKAEKREIAFFRFRRVIAAMAEQAEKQRQIAGVGRPIQRVPIRGENGQGVSVEQKSDAVRQRQNGGCQSGGDPKTV